MENTSQFLFDNTDETYFLASQGKAIGPLTAEEVYERISKGEIGLLHFIWKEGWSDWKRICDEREFAILVPQKPSSASIKNIREKVMKKAQVQAEEIKNYYLYFNSSQYGPFSKPELFRVLDTHKVGRNAYLWTPGWPNWKRITELEEFASHFDPVTLQIAGSESTGPVVRTGKKKKNDTKSTRTKRGTKETARDDRTMGVKLDPRAGIDASEKRGAPRRPLVARLFLHNDKDVIIAVCRDISIGGMQVLTDRVPGPVGSVIKLNVSSGDPNKVKSFVAEGEIVRVLEDGRGFSFRFLKITDEAKKTIQKYILE